MFEDMQIKMPNTSAMTEPKFDEKYLAEAFAILDSMETRSAAGTSRDPNKIVSPDDLEQHAQNITRLKCLDDCENAIAELSPKVVEYLTGVFDQITDSFLPAPLWQAPSPPSKSPSTSKSKRDVDVGTVLRSLRIVSASRLVLANSTAKDLQMKAKVEKLYQAASRYLDSIPEYDDQADIEALLLLAELEYGRNQNIAAKTRLKNVITALTESSCMRTALIFGHNSTLIRRRNALRTALMMLHWYFNEVPAPLEDLKIESEAGTNEGVTSAEELFITSQLRLASLHHKLKRFLDAQPFVDEKTWQICERAFSMWYDDLREHSRSVDNFSEDAPVNFFVFHQQYLTTRIILSKSHERLYKRRSGMRPMSAPREPWTCPTSAKTDAVKIATSLRNYGQRHRFREAPLSFVNHISAAADVVLHATENSTNEDDRNAYLHISSFLCGVLKYMAEVHVRAATLVEAVQQRINIVLQGGLIRSNSNVSGRAGSSTYSHDTHLWQWTRYDLTDDFGSAPGPSEVDRPHSVIGVLQTSPSSKQKRPPIARQSSIPTKLESHAEMSMEDLNTATPSFYSIKDDRSTLNGGE